MDMDLDELLDGPAPAQAPSRRERFAPKGAKLKPKPNIEKLPVKKEETATRTLEHPVDDVMEEVKKEEVDDLMETEEAVNEEDDVVKSIDVYLNPSLDENTLLYVFQFPLRSEWMAYDLDNECTEVRVKPTTKEVEFNLPIDVKSKNYYPRPGNGENLTQQTLKTMWPPSSLRSGHAVGVLKGDELHLTPVHAIVQLRPSMQHLDPKESRRKTNATNDGERKVKIEDPAERTSSKASKKVSMPVVETDNSGEDWVPLEFHGHGTEKASTYLQKMVEKECLPIEFDMTSSDYLHNLCPRTSTAGSQSVGPPQKSGPNLPLNERFKTNIQEGLHKFASLKYLAPDESDEEVLVALVEHALLVQGLWVPKRRDLKGMEAIARDYVLLLFSQDVVIKNSKLSKLPQQRKLADAMRKYLNVFGKERQVFNDWKLKENPDMNFIKQFPSVVGKQRDQWNQLEMKIKEMTKVPNKPGVKTMPDSNTTNNPAKSRSSSEVGTGIANAASSKRAMPEESREAISRALMKFFKSVKVCSSQHMNSLLREFAVSEHQRSTPVAREAITAADSIDAFPDDFQAIIGKDAVNIHGVWVPKSSQEHPKLDPIREVVLDLFLAEGAAAKLKRATILEAAKVKLGNEVPPTDLQKVLQEICKAQGPAWVLKPGDGSPNH